MKVLITLALFAAVALALPEGRRLRPEEHWRPAKPRDISKYKPRHAMFPKQMQDVTWEEHIIKLTKEAKKLTGNRFPTKTSNVEAVAAECGIEGPPSLNKIVGGEEAAEHQFPWIVALFIDDMYFCGGAVLNENYVLTAAHCADGAFYFDVWAGAHNVRESSEPHRVEITSFNGFTHPDWDSNTLSNDLALVELPSPIDFNDYIKPSCLPASGDAAAEGDLVTVTGWGKPSDDAGGISPVLRMVSDLPVISNSDCNDVYGIVGDGVVCIDTTGGKGSCNGDSGGPLVTKAGAKTAAGQKWNQVGIVSFGSSSGCEVGYPAGFTRTEYYLDWIMSNSS